MIEEDSEDEESEAPETTTPVIESKPLVQEIGSTPTPKPSSDWLTKKDSNYSQFDLTNLNKTTVQQSEESSE